MITFCTVLCIAEALLSKEQTQLKVRQVSDPDPITLALPLSGYHKLDVQLKFWLSHPEAFVRTHPHAVRNGQPDNPLLPVIFKSSSDDPGALVTKAGGYLHTRLGHIYTALIPLKSVLEFASNAGIIRIEASSLMKQNNLKAKQLCGADRVHAGKLPDNTPYTGKGIIVGIFDSGIDFVHPDFREKQDSTKTRILSIWDQRSNSGTSPQNYNYGSEWSKTQLNGALKFANSINTHDYDGHGTHVAGTAAGLRGLAYDAELIVVNGKITWDSDSTVYQDSKSLLDGLTYMMETSKAAGKPCVANVSIGYNIGSAHDGSSLMEQGMDYLVSNNSQFFIVVAAGNENEKNMHFGGFDLTEDSVWTYMNTGLLYSVFSNSDADSTFVSFMVDSVVFANTNFDRYSVQKTIFQSSWISIKDIENTAGGIHLPVYFGNGDTAMQLQAFASAYDAGRTELRLSAIQGNYIDLDSVWGNAVVRLLIKGKGKLHGWWENYQIGYIENPYFAGNVYKDDRHRFSDNKYTMNILACGRNTLSVGASVSQPSFINISKQKVYGLNYLGDSTGTIAFFSSLGPCTDGRIKPDISAPGVNIASSLSRDASKFLYFMTDPKTIVQSGTSMAAPVVTGAVAMYLQQNPSASIEGIRSALCGNAIVDSFVTKFGAVPNNHSGYGRLDIYKAMGGPFNTRIEDLNDGISGNTLVYPNPGTDFIGFHMPETEGKIHIEIFDATGKSVLLLHTGPDYLLDVQTWKKGIYLYRVTSDQSQSTGKFLVE